MRSQNFVRECASVSFSSRMRITAVVIGLFVSGCSPSSPSGGAGMIECAEIRGAEGVARLQYDSANSRVVGIFFCNSNPEKTIEGVENNASGCPATDSMEYMAGIRLFCETPAIFAP